MFKRNSNAISVKQDIKEDDPPVFIKPMITIKPMINNEDSIVLFVPETLNSMRINNQVIRIKYLEALVIEYDRFKQYAIDSGRLFFSICLNKTYISKQEIDSSPLKEKAVKDGLLLVFYTPEYHHKSYLVFCDPNLYKNKTFTSDVEYDIKFTYSTSINFAPLID